MAKNAMVCLQRRKSFHFGLRTTLLNTGKQRSPASDIFFYFTFDQWEDILLFVAPFLAPDSDPPTPEFWSFPGADYVPFWESFVRNLSWHFLPLLLKSRWQSWHFFQNTYGILDSTLFFGTLRIGLPVSYPLCNFIIFKTPFHATFE